MKLNPSDTTKQMKAVLVTTKHRGVFFGYQKSLDGDLITLARCRCAIYFGAKGGFLELAKTGPTENSRIGSEAEEVVLYDVTSISNVSSEAEDKWLSA